MDYPKIMRDVIRQHHGTTLVKYFYHQAKLKSQQTNLPYGELEGDAPDESTYRYDGPKPQFKESAIIFFADSPKLLPDLCQKLPIIVWRELS